MFYIPLLIIPNILFASLAATDDWPDIFIELSVVTSNFLYGVVIGGLVLFRVYLKLELFFVCAPFLHWLTKNFIAH